MEPAVRKDTRVVENEILTPPNNPPVFIDLFNFARNPEGSIVTISACYRMDGGVPGQPRLPLVEHSRIAITTEHAKRAMDVLARMLNYYPQKPETPPPVKEEPTKNKK